MFQFVIATNPEEAQSKARQRKYRQHAIRKGLQNKRDDLARRNDNFLPVSFDDQSGKPTKSGQVRQVALSRPVAPQRLDPFNSLPGDGERLRILLGHKSSKHAGEPVFCAESAGKVYFDGMDKVFRGALSNPTLFHALSLTLALAANRNVPNIEYLSHRGATLKNLRKRMSEPKLVPSVSTLTAMLLLIGYEYRVDGVAATSIAMHLKAVENVIDMTNSDSIAVSDALQRALFWQDLYSSLFVGTQRMLSHHDYSRPNFDRRTAERSENFVPFGFSTMSFKVPEAFRGVIRDLNMLCAALDGACGPFDQPVDVFPIDHTQYTLESRLVDCLNKARYKKLQDPVYEACIWAAFLCCYKLSTGVWEGCFIPEFCASQILGLVSNAKDDSRWEQSKELLLWLLFISGALTKQSRISSRAIVMIQYVHRDRLAGMYNDWEQLHGTMKMFIWSAHAMEQSCLRLWEETGKQSKLTSF